MKSKKLVRISVVGVGGMGQGHCRSIVDKVPEAKLSAVVDSSPATAKMVGEQHKVPFFTSVRDLIKAQVVDAVIVANPPPVHHVSAIECMKAGIHVISEKPLSETITNAEKMVKAAKKHRVAFAVMFQRRFEPVIEKAVEIVRTGQIGRIYRSVMISPEYRSQAYYDSSTWRATWKGEGGGVMMNQAPHIMDIFVQLAGVPAKVSGRIETSLHTIEVEDKAEALLQYKDGGTGYFYCSTNEPPPGQMIEIFGDKGKLVLRNGTLELYRFSAPVKAFTRKNKEMWAAPKAERVEFKLAERPTGHFLVIRNFARHILKGEALRCAGETGLASLELANAITLSSFTRKEVSIPVNRRAYDALLAKLRRASRSKKGGIREQRTTDPRH